MRSDCDSVNILTERLLIMAKKGELAWGFSSMNNTSAAFIVQHTVQIKFQVTGGSSKPNKTHQNLPKPE